MALLKKVKSATLMETLIATVLIVVVFMMSSFILNNLFFSTVKNNTRSINVYLIELEYMYLNKQLILPYKDNYNNWNIEVLKNNTTIEFIAKHNTNKQLITKTILEN